MRWQVFSGDEHTASCKYAEDAAALVSLIGKGAKIKCGNKVVWNEDEEEFAAEESFDKVAALCQRRSES